MSHESRRVEEAERKVIRLYIDLANLQADINKAKDTLKDLTGGSGPGSKGGGSFPGVIGGGGGGFYTGPDGGFDWGDGTGSHGGRGGLVDAESDWDDTIPWPGSAACRIYVYVYDSSTSNPIQGATVKVTISGFGSTTRTTNASGYCSFDVNNGTSVTIDVSKSGYTSQSRSVTISAGYRGIHRENFNLVALAPPGPGDPCSLDVLVKDSSGSPINDAPVKIIVAGVPTVQNTDSSGHTTFSVTQGASLSIDVYPTGYNSQTRSITVSAGSDGIDHQTFSLDDAGADTHIGAAVDDPDTGYTVSFGYQSVTGNGHTHTNTLTIECSNGASFTYSVAEPTNCLIACHVGEVLTVRVASFSYYSNDPIAHQWTVRTFSATSGSVTAIPEPHASIALHPTRTSIGNVPY